MLLALDTGFSSESQQASLPQRMLPVQGTPGLGLTAGIKPSHSKYSELRKPLGRGSGGALHRGAEPAQLRQAGAMTKPPELEDGGSEGPRKRCLARSHVPATALSSPRLCR